MQPAEGWNCQRLQGLPSSNIQVERSDNLFISGLDIHEATYLKKGY